MRKLELILLSFFLFIAANVRAQCPDTVQLKIRLGQVFRVATGFKEVIAGLHYSADSLSKCATRSNLLYITTLKTIGYLYSRQGDYLSAIRSYRQVISFINENTRQDNAIRVELLGAYYWLSEFYDALGNKSEQLKFSDSCITYGDQLAVTNRSNLKSLYTMVEYYYDIGDYYRCIDYAERCERLGRKYADGELRKGNQNESRIALEYCFSSIAWNANARFNLENYESAARLLKNKLEDCRKSGLTKYLGTIYGHLAEIELNNGDYQKAYRYLLLSLDNDRKAGFNLSCKQTLNNIGSQIYFDHFKDFQKSYIAYKQALQYVNDNIDPDVQRSDVAETINIYTNIAKLFASNGQFDSAYYYYRSAYAQLGPGFDENELVKSARDKFSRYKKIYYLSGLLIEEANTYKEEFVHNRNTSALLKALHIYKRADQFLSVIKSEQKDLNSKLFWRKDTRKLYENAIDASLLNNDNSSAFYFFERSRAVLLQESLSQQNWLGTQDIMQQTQVEKKILSLTRERDALQPTSSEYNQLNDELFIQSKNLDHLRQLIKTNNPLYYQRSIDTSAITIDDVRLKLLKNKSALVELFYGDSALYMLVITAQKVQLKKIEKSIFDSTSPNFVKYLVDANLINSDYTGFLKVSHDLYSALFNNTNIPPGGLIISPDGINFPFEALVTGFSNIKPKYFVEDYAVSYTFSARFLLNDFSGTANGRARDVFGMAPVQFNNGTRLAVLSGSDQSLDRLKKYFGSSEMLIAKNATKYNFLNQFYLYRIIQLYTHATDSSSRNEPVIYFADSALYLSDLIYENKPATQLIVLSACETAKGRLYKGEGVFSFSRGFAALGIPSSISTLWSVNDVATYRLTESFYKHLSEGLPLDIALQKAKLEFLKSSDKEKQLPYFWAGPVLAGKSDPIQIQNSFKLKWVGVGIVVVLLLLGYFNWKAKVSTKTVD